MLKAQVGRVDADEGAAPGLVLAVRNDQVLGVGVVVHGDPEPGVIVLEADAVVMGVGVGEDGGAGQGQKGGDQDREKPVHHQPRARR